MNISNRTTKTHILIELLWRMYKIGKVAGLHPNHDRAQKQLAKRIIKEISEWFQQEK